MNYDLIVVGGGVVGCQLATRVAQAGFKAAILDRRDRKDIGHLWDVAVNRGVFNQLGIIMPPENTFKPGPDETRFFAKDPNLYVRVGRELNAHLVALRHRDLNRIFLRRAEKAGVKFLGGHTVKALILRDEQCFGVTGQTKRKPFDLEANVTADCTGVHAILRRKAPASFQIERQIQAHDFASAWQEEWSVKKEMQYDKKMMAVPGISYTHIGKYHAFTSFYLRTNGLFGLTFGSSVAAKKMAYMLCQKYVKRNQYLLRRVSGDGSIIPLRRSLDNFVGNGFLVAGDSACQVIPTMGSGIEPSLVAADAASRAVICAHNENDFSARRLWQYNYQYQREIGAVLASYDIVRRFLQSVTENEMQEILEAELIDNDKFATTFSTSEMSYDITDIIGGIKKIIAHPRLLPTVRRFRIALRDVKKALTIYQSYPKEYNLKKFSAWRQKSDKLFSQYQT